MTGIEYMQLEAGQVRHIRDDLHAAVFPTRAAAGKAIFNDHWL